MAIDKAYRLTKGKPDKPAKAEQGKGKEETAPDYEGFQVPDEITQSTESQAEPGKGCLERLELWVHRENLHIPAGNDLRLEAARSMIQGLHGFAVPEEFIRDIHTFLQALFQADLDGQAAPEAAIDAAVLDMVGAGNEE
jgi:hypothetical protein